MKHCSDLEAMRPYMHTTNPSRVLPSIARRKTNYSTTSAAIALMYLSRMLMRSLLSHSPCSTRVRISAYMSFQFEIIFTLKEHTKMRLPPERPQISMRGSASLVGCNSPNLSILLPMLFPFAASVGLVRFNVDFGVVEGDG